MIQRAKSFNEAIQKPISIQTSRIKEIKNALYVSTSSFSEFSNLESKMKSTRKDYFKRCKDFESHFLKHKILKDICYYDEMARIDEVNQKHHMKKYHDKLVSSRERYDKALGFYNINGKSLLMKNVSMQNY